MEDNLPVGKLVKAYKHFHPEEGHFEIGFYLDKEFTGYRGTILSGYDIFVKVDKTFFDSGRVRGVKELNSAKNYAVSFSYDKNKLENVILSDNLEDLKDMYKDAENFYENTKKDFAKNGIQIVSKNGEIMP